MQPIYRTDGAWVGVYQDGHIFNLDGDWIGFVIGREAYDPQGDYLGFLSDDRRLLRKRMLGETPPRKEAPPPPVQPRIPANMPLAPLMKELPFHIIDMFEEYEHRLLAISERRPDME